MPRGLKVSCPLIATMILFVNIRNFYKLNFLDNMTFSIAHWDTSKNCFFVSVCKGMVLLSILMASVMCATLVNL